MLSSSNALEPDDDTDSVCDVQPRLNETAPSIKCNIEYEIAVTSSYQQYFARHTLSMN